MNLARMLVFLQFNHQLKIDLCIVPIENTFKLMSVSADIDHRCKADQWPWFDMKAID